MKNLTSLFVMLMISGVSCFASADGLSKRDLRDIDSLTVQLLDHAQELHDEYHQHLEGVRHAQKLDKDVTLLEKIAESLHGFSRNADGSEGSMRRLRTDTNEFLQLASRISRTIDLTEPWLRSPNAHAGIRHMRSAARDVLRIAGRIDSYLPVDTEVIDNQADRLEVAVKMLHDEFHEHLEGYEVSQHLDQDLENLEELVEHLHDMAHDKTWAEIDLRHVADDIRQIQQETSHIEELFVRQARIGVRTRDWVGIEHSRDAITDVLASAGLLSHMIRKADPRASRIHDRRRILHNDHRRDLDRYENDHRRRDRELDRDRYRYNDRRNEWHDDRYEWHDDRYAWHEDRYAWHDDRNAWHDRRYNHNWR